MYHQKKIGDSINISDQFFSVGKFQKEIQRFFDKKKLSEFFDENKAGKFYQNIFI